MRFEDLCKHPETELGRVLDWLGLDPIGRSAELGSQPEDSEVCFRDSQALHMARSYLDALGESVVTLMGYSWKDLQQRLSSIRLGTRTSAGGWSIRSPASTDWFPKEQPKEQESVGREPLVSVITPCLNAGTFLARCISSVEMQTYTNVEHIIIDGGSTDQTVDLLERCRRNELRWISEPDNGQADAINKGFRMANGAIVTWLNADDTLRGYAVQDAVEAFLQVPSAGVVYGDIEIVDIDGRRSIRRAPKRLKRGAFDSNNPLPQPGTFFKASALRSVGGLNESLYLAFDFDLWSRLFQAGAEFQHVPKVMATFHVHDGSKTARADPGEFWAETAIAHLTQRRLPQAKSALDRSSWRETFNSIQTFLTQGRYRDARMIAREGWRSLHPPKRRLMGAFLATTALSPRISGLVLRKLGRS
jgi:GT2 family glycosyltransferase